MVLASTLRPYPPFAVPVCNGCEHAGKDAGRGDRCAMHSAPHPRAAVVYELRTLRDLRVERSSETGPGAHARHASLLDDNQFAHKRLKDTCPTG